MQCFHCGTNNGYQTRYCTECGKQLQRDGFDDSDENRKYFSHSIILILSVFLVVVISSQSVTNLPFIAHEILFNGLLVLISIIFLFFDWKRFFSLLRFRFYFKPLLIIMLLAPGMAVSVVVLSNYLNQAFNLEFSNHIEAFRIACNSFIIGILFISVLPALVEEILFRGLLFNNLLRFTRPKNVILITGILFSFVHFSFISLIWLFPIGLILGYFRFRYRTIWYAVLFHMVYNASVFMLDPILSY